MGRTLNDSMPAPYSPLWPTCDSRIPIRTADCCMLPALPPKQLVSPTGFPRGCQTHVHWVLQMQGHRLPHSGLFLVGGRARRRHLTAGPGLSPHSSPHSDPLYFLVEVEALGDQGSTPSFAALAVGVFLTLSLCLIHRHHGMSQKIPF